jgi:hypothetical protein
MLSQDRLYAAISYHGVGTYANKDLKPNEVAMEITANYTISSYDNIFPHFDQLESVLKKHENNTHIIEVNTLRILLNLNYMRYMTQPNRFFRIWFDNLPKHKDYLPFWNRQEKDILKKLINDPLIESDLFLHNETYFDYLLEDCKKVLRKFDPNLEKLMLTDSRVDEAINIINSRTHAFTLKGWKIIHNKISEVEESDIQNYGYIIIPGVDAINHESMTTEHPDVAKSQLNYVKGKIQVKAGRKFKKGEEFTINYDTFATLYEIFKRYGFVPIEALYKNMIFRNDGIDMSKSPREGRLLCLALKACHHGTKEDTQFYVPKFTNEIDMAHLNIERLNYWYGAPLVESKIWEIYNNIMAMKHHNITEGMALSRWAYSFYGQLLYASNFRTGIERLIKMYNENEEGKSVREIIKESGIKVEIRNEPPELKDRFREIMKYCLINHHIIALNTREAYHRLNKVMDNLIYNLKNDIVEETS